MESNKPGTGETPSFFTPLLQGNDFACPYWRNDAADTAGMFQNSSSAIAGPMSLPYMPLQSAPSPWKDRHGAFQSNTHYISEACGNAIVDLNQLHNFQKPITDPPFFNVGSTMPCLYGQDLQYPGQNVKGTSRIHDVMNNSVDFNSFQDPGINKRIPLIRNSVGGGYEPLSGEADVRNISGPQIRNFIGSGGSSTYQIPNSVRPQIKNFVVSGGSKTNNTHHSEVSGIVKNDELCAARFGFPNNVDGSFLSLGIGSNTDVKSKSDHSSREITGGGLYGSVNPQLSNLRAQQEARRSFNRGYNFVGGRPSFQNNVGGFSSLGNHGGGWPSSYTNSGVRSGINTCPNSSQFHYEHKPEADMQHAFPAARYPNLDAYERFIGPCSGSSTQVLASGRTPASGLESGSLKPSWTTGPTSDQLQKHSAETMNKVSPECAMVSSFIRLEGSSSRQEHSGQLFSNNDIAAPSGADDGMFPKRIGVQVSKDSAPLAAGRDLFPQRLGVNVNEYKAAPAAGDGVFHRSTGIRGCSGEGLQAHLRKDLIRPAFPSGQTFSNASGSGLSRASNVLGVPLPSLKRRAMPPPPAAPRNQRRKVTLPPPVHPYMLSSHAALAPHHIKWTGLDGLPQPIGQKCMLCKRDISFAPEGPVHQPTVPPSVAVLPCGHTFHDNCLQTITPEDQAKDPPCIPCAIGEI